MDLGTLIEHDGRPAVRLERDFGAPPEQLWSAVSDPDELARWFPSKVGLEDRVGGTVTFSGDPNIDDSAGVVLAYEPPTRLAYTWGDDELHFAVSASDGGSRLVLVNVLGDRTAAARNAAGWTVCLGELGKLLAGSATADGPHSDTAQAWEPIYDAYIAAGFPSGAPLPSH